MSVKGRAGDVTYGQKVSRCCGRPGRHLSQVHTSNNTETTVDFVVCCFDIVQDCCQNGNNVKATFDFVEAKFDFVAFDNVVSTLLLMWTGL